MDHDRFLEQVAEVRTLFEERLKVRGRTLDRQVRKAGRILPRSVRRDAEYLAHAATLAQNPKLLRMIDMTRADHAHGEVVAWLKGIDPKDRAKGRMINMLAVIAFNILLFAGILIWFLVWRGYV